MGGKKGFVSAPIAEQSHWLKRPHMRVCAKGFLYPIKRRNMTSRLRSHTRARVTDFFEHHRAVDRNCPWDAPASGDACAVQGSYSSSFNHKAQARDLICVMCAHAAVRLGANPSPAHQGVD
jgi:hypothetical protein